MNALHSLVKCVYPAAIYRHLSAMAMRIGVVGGFEFYVFQVICSVYSERQVTSFRYDERWMFYRGAINYIYARLFLKLLTSHHTETKQPSGFIINKVIASLDSNASRVKKKKKNSLPELDFLQSTQFIVSRL
ncbi:hypothetical protein GQX74_005771 [Glossina fuscipes]|nr:hypothetical protein GQX74_005771 [Glossina fuscipes]